LEHIDDDSGPYYFVQQLLKRSPKQSMTRGLMREFNHLLKSLLKSAALDAIRKEPFKTFYQLRISAGGGRDGRYGFTVHCAGTSLIGYHRFCGWGRIASVKPLLVAAAAGELQR
jgi:hypothetical protein